MANTILIVADDLTIQSQLTTLLSPETFTLYSASFGSEALHSLARLPTDLVIIDQSTPNTRARTSYSDIMKKYPHLPLITIISGSAPAPILSLNDPEEYLKLPVVKSELIECISSLIKKRNTSEIIQVGDLYLNSRTHDVRRDEKEIRLTSLEFKLLHYLMMNKGRIVTREMILHRIWRYSSDVETRVVDVYIGYLRKKIDKDFDKKLLYSVRGFGYVIKE